MVKFGWFASALLSCFMLSLVFAEEFIDLETLPHLRTRQYPKQFYDKIVVFSFPRTGSSLTYNVFRFLFEEERCLDYPHDEFRFDRSVLRTHRIHELKSLIQKEEKVLYIVNIRDPIQSSISWYRIHSKPVKVIETFSRNACQRNVRFFQFLEKLQREGLPIVIFKYEELEQKQCDYLLDFIEKHFEVSIDERDVQMIKAGYSRENIFRNIRSFPNFDAFLPISGFHGKHVSPDAFLPPSKLLYWLHRHFNEVKPLFQKYGYLMDTNSVDGK